MRSGFRWWLIGTVLVSALALWWPDEVSQPAANRRTAQPFAAAEQAAVAPPSAGLGALALPERLPTASLEAARFDPFVGGRPASAPAPKPAPAKAAVTAPSQPPQPIAPTLSYRYLGQMTDPSGVQRIYLANSDAAIAVTVGMRLDEGYVVQSIGPAGIRLHYPPLDAHAVIPVPAAQDPTLR